MKECSEVEGRKTEGSRKEKSGKRENKVGNRMKKQKGTVSERKVIK